MIFFCFNLFAQKKVNKQTKPIIEEGFRLYKSEMTSWNGSDLFLEKYKKRNNIGGYFSFSEDGLNKCVFFSKNENPKVIGTITFGDNFEKSATVNLEERDFTQIELELYSLRREALAIIRQDTLFKKYENTNLNIIPLLDKKENKVYVLTGPTQNGVVIFGNDYLLTFGKKNNLTSKKSLHKNIIPIEYNQNEEVEISMHSHLSETGDFITATDICTLMLYGKFTGWKQHNVVSEKYLNSWNIKTNQLFIVTMDVVRKINEDKKKKN